jgi:hypothetical protein
MIEITQEIINSFYKECFEKSSYFCEELENSNILFFPSSLLSIIKKERNYLLNEEKIQNQTDPIIYRPKENMVISSSKKNIQQKQHLNFNISNLSKTLYSFISSFLRPYSNDWQFLRSIIWPGKKQSVNAIENQNILSDFLPWHKVNGDRILRFFINLDEERECQWLSSDSFNTVVKKFAGTSYLPFPKAQIDSLSEKIERKMKKMCCSMGISFRALSVYDMFLFRLKAFLKKNKDFQKNCSKNIYNFAPFSGWLLFTDSNCYSKNTTSPLLEMTFIIPRKKLLNPEKAPASILERLSRNMVVESSIVDLS